MTRLSRRQFIPSSLPAKARLVKLPLEVGLFNFKSGQPCDLDRRLGELQEACLLRKILLRSPWNAIC
jgi:hypothetical protein